MALSGGVLAQSSVSLYGLIDESLLFNSNNRGGRVIGLSDNGIQGNRIGLFGTENLGGGLSAVFRLENGFNATTGVMGQGVRLFGSQAYIGVTGDFGSLRAGRQLNTDVSLIAIDFAAASQWAGILGSHPGDVDNFYDTFRVPGALKYISPKISGLSFQLLYAPGNIAGHISQGQVASIATAFEYGPVLLGASYNNAQTPNLGLAAGTANVNTPIIASGVFYTSPVESGFSSAQTYQVISGGASYTIGSTILGALYTNTQFRGLGDLDSGPNPSHYTGTATFQNIEFNARYAISPALTVGAAYTITIRNSVSTISVPDGLGSARYIQATVGIQYLLYKTTFVYAQAMTQRASGTDSTGQPAVAANNFIGASSNARQSAVRIGLNVHF
ncbi:porin [Paraburkholderia caribensis]|uniref:porin n=1 Tax=Paraburkholderia caribensis TaxID=75105 RepID=UPI002096B0CD|nr:porin [Paraburkholderia caribensis]